MVDFMFPTIVELLNLKIDCKQNDFNSKFNQVKLKIDTI